jgi:hypothetical protein
LLLLKEILLHLLLPDEVLLLLSYDRIVHCLPRRVEIGRAFTCQEMRYLASACDLRDCLARAGMRRRVGGGTPDN